ncbi:MAG: cell division protein ZapD [Gammaproteobacteria bacterium]|nr:cell division protein ZapD [Gammaproteobacteria bacterium]
MNETTIYEQPLNERIRTFLRLEFLFLQLKYMLEGQSEWESRAAISTLIDILYTINRGDFKSETIKELERQEATLTRLQQTPAVDHSLLSSILDNLKGLTHHLYSIKGQIGNDIRQNELLKSIMQRNSIPGGTCDFDIPVYHFWLQQAASERRQLINQWFSSLEIVQLSVSFLLKLLRESATPQKETAVAGNYQKKLETDNTCQLIRALVSKKSPYFAEISGGKHRFSIRFMEATPATRPKQTEQDVQFQLSCCML